MSGKAAAAAGGSTPKSSARSAASSSSSTAAGPKLTKAQAAAALAAAQAAAVAAADEAARAAASAPKEEQYYFEEVEVPEDSEDPEEAFTEVPVTTGDDEGAEYAEDAAADADAAAAAGQEADEDYAALVHSLKNTHTTFPSLANKGATPKPSAASPTAAASASAAAAASSTPSDQWLLRKLRVWNLVKTSEMFLAEWADLRDAGGLPTPAQIGVVPAESVASRASKAEGKVQALERELTSTGSVALQARESWEKLKRERDYHRMHHQRVLQEKGILMRDLKRIKSHYESFEPAIAAIKAKYEGAMKEKMMMRLERDRYKIKVEALENQLKAATAAAGITAEGGETKEQESSTTATAASTSAASSSGKPKDKAAAAPRKAGSHPKDSPLPAAPAPGALPNSVSLEAAFAQYEPAPVARYQLRKTFKGHRAAISGLALHPKKPLLCTVSDDQSWKLWSLPRGELLMSGEGHKDWVAACDFHPGGTLLATASGDSTVKLWDFARASCSATFNEHTQAVWDVAFHPSGDFMVSASMDHTAKLWDLGSSRCRQTFRGHVDSVNSVVVQPGGNGTSIATGSGDKTVSIWDIRSGLCAQTFYGHQNAVNHTSFSPRGDLLLSSDADGVVKAWDVRLVGERACFRSNGGGQAGVNESRFDRSSSLVALACDDATVKLYSSHDAKWIADLEGHEDAVQAVLFDPAGQFIVSASSDQTFRIWA